MDVLQIEKRIRGRVKPQMEKSQREYYLNEQMKAIQKELGDMEDAPNELDDLEKRIAKAGMPKEAREKATAELNKLKLMSPMSAEATVVRNYVDWLVKVPWKKRTKVHHDIAARAEGPRRGPLRPREGQGTHRRVPRRAAARRSGSRARSCASSARRASARPRSASRSRARPTASSCACRWAACATRPRSAATAAPTSARCRARSCRTWRGPACATRCSCSTRSTRWRWTSAATRRRRCSRCSIPSRTPRSTTTTSRSTSTCPR